MKNLTTIAKSNDINYRQLRDKLVVLNIIYKNRKRYIPTDLALQEGIAVEHSRFGNEVVLTINYHYDEQKVMDHYWNDIKLWVDDPLPF